MSKSDPIVLGCPPSKASVLAETVAAGLHSLAQPLTATQWHLEIASMPGTTSERQEREVSEALVSLEQVISQLDYLRDIIRPFRALTEYKRESVREAMQCAIEMQRDALQHEGVQITFREDRAEGMVVAPHGYAQRICFCLCTWLRSLAPLSVTLDISELGESVVILASLACSATQAEKLAVHGSAVLRSYVEVIGGELEIAPNLVSARISLPVLSSAT